MSRATLPSEWQPSQQLREILSWKLAVGLLRAYPSLKFEEAHPGGGMYDCLAFVSEGEHSKKTLYLNRGGSATVFVGGPDDLEQWPTVWAETAASESVRPIVERLGRMLSLHPVAKLPPSTNEVIAFRVAIELLQAIGLSGDFRHLRMGYYNSSGMVFDQVPHDRYEPFPHMTERFRVDNTNDPFPHPGFRFWFLLEENEPLLAFERDGTFENRSGLVVDAATEYRTNGRKLWPIITQVAGDLLP